MSSVARVDPGASVSKRAEIADDVFIGPFVVVEDDVTVAAGATLLAGTVLHAGARVGRRCRLGPYAVVGGTPMDSAFGGEPSLAVLEDDVELREFATVHRATGEGEATRVGEGTLVMSYAHVSHNVQVGPHCVLTTSVQLGGHCSVGERAFLGSTAILHQYCRVGEYAMFGAGSAGNMDVLPFMMARGNPARHFRLNGVGLKRNGIDGERYRKLEGAWRALRRRDRDRLETLAQDSTDVRRLVDFITSSRRGVARFVSGGDE